MKKFRLYHVFLRDGESTEPAAKTVHHTLLCLQVVNSRLCDLGLQDIKQTFNPIITTLLKSLTSTLDPLSKNYEQRATDFNPSPSSKKLIHSSALWPEFIEISSQSEKHTSNINPLLPADLSLNYGIEFWKLFWSPKCPKQTPGT